MKLKLLLLFLSLNTFLYSQITVTTITEAFDASGGVKLGPDGYIYIGNYGQALPQANGTQVWRMRPGEEPEVFATGLMGASGNAFDSQGNFYQSNISGGRISKITPDGIVTTFASVGIVAPVGIAIDEADNLYVCNCGNNTIRKVTPEGVSTLFSSGTIFRCPNGITIGHEGNLYVSNFENGAIIKITPDGSPSIFAVIPGSNNGHLTYYEPWEMFFVNSHGSSSVYKMTIDGTVTRIAGTGTRGNQDGNAIEATFSRPNGIAASVTGDTLFLNSSIPLQDGPTFPLNPSVIRMLTGVKQTLENGGCIVDTRNVPIVKKSINVFPNPAVDEASVTFELGWPETVSLKLMDMEGKLVKKIVDNELSFPGGNNWAVNISDLPSGIYLIVVEGEGFSANRKLIVK